MDEFWQAYKLNYFYCIPVLLIGHPESEILVFVFLCTLNVIELVMSQKTTLPHEIHETCNSVTFYFMKYLPVTHFLVFAGSAFYQID